MKLLLSILLTGFLLVSNYSTAIAYPDNNTVKVKVKKEIVKLSINYREFANSDISVYIFQVEDNTIRAVHKTITLADKNGKFKLQQELDPGKYQVWVWKGWPVTFKEEFEVY